MTVVQELRQSDIQDEYQKYSMPPIEHGEIVAWYPSGLRTARCETAVVYRVSHDNVHLITATRGVKEAVKHITDPRLKLNPDQREMGAWDYTVSHKLRTEMLEAMNGRISLLENQVTQLTSQLIRSRAKESRVVEDEGTPQGQVLAGYRELRQRVLDLGVHFTGNPKQEWLEEQIERIEERQQARQEMTSGD